MSSGRGSLMVSYVRSAHGECRPMPCAARREAMMGLDEEQGAPGSGSLHGQHRSDRVNGAGRLSVRTRTVRGLPMAFQQVYPCRRGREPVCNTYGRGRFDHENQIVLPGTSIGTTVVTIP